MKSDLFRRYVWLIDVIRHAKKISYEEISSLWRDSALNDDQSPMALRTFHNHREAISHLFGIRILCDRCDHNRYYVEETRGMDPTKLKVWMLQTLSLSHLLEKSNDVDGRIVVDITPEEKFGMVSIIEAMQNNRQIDVTYSLPTEEGKTSMTVSPYCIRFWNRVWYLLAEDADDGKMRVFDLSRLKSIKIRDERFLYNETFKAANFFKNYYGMDIEPNREPETIRLRVRGRSLNLIRTQPLHETQKEIIIESDSSVFEYCFVPCDDFKRTVLSMGCDVEILMPETLRQEISDQIACMASNYK